MNNAVTKSELVWFSVTTMVGADLDTPYTHTEALIDALTGAKIERHKDGAGTVWVIATTNGRWGYKSLKAALAVWNAPGTPH
jgi:hypothetical protein